MSKARRAQHDLSRNSALEAPAAGSDTSTLPSTLPWDMNPPRVSTLPHNEHLESGQLKSGQLESEQLESEQLESEQEFYTALASIHTEVGASGASVPEGLSQPAQKDHQTHFEASFREPLPETGIDLFKVLGAVHSYTDAECILKVDSIQVAVLFIPWKDQILLINKSTRLLGLASEPDKRINLEIGPKKSAAIDPGYWSLRNNNTSLRFLLRPCRYHLLLEVETKKRIAGAASSASKRARVSAEHLHGRDETTSRHQAQPGNAVIRRVPIDEVDSLASFGVPMGHTLTIVDSISGVVEYSIRRLDSWAVERPHVVVFKAVFRKASESKLVIVKLHKPSGEGDSTQQAIQRWKAEVRVHRGLHHPCIASLVAFDARLLAVTVELKHAYDLSSSYWFYGRRAQEAGHFKGTIDDACKICTDIASALEYLEQEGVVHYDIKAANILYSKQDGATLIDFGLSKFVDEGITMGGSPWYRDPRMKDTGNKEIALSDVYSLGVVMLYVMGELPLPEREPGWLIYDAHRGVPKALAQQMAWLEKIGEKRNGLQAPLPGSRGGKEVKLRRLVCKMLARRNDRINARDLAKEAHW